MESVHSEEITTELVDEDATLTADDSGVEGTGAETAGTAAETESTATDAAGQVTLTEDEVGKTVVDATGEEVGLVTDVEESGEAVYVDAHPGITDRIKAALDWGDAGEDDYPVEVEEIERVTDDRVELKGAEELEGKSVDR